MFPTIILAMLVSGIVHDPAGQPIGGASVSIANVKSVETAADGTFTLDVPEGRYTIVVGKAGFRTEQVASQPKLDITLAPKIAETIEVSGIRAEEKTPVTKSEMDRPEIERKYAQQDVPLLLRDTPSIDAWSESGVGDAGYSYFTLRGVSPTRINFTLDGVPLADSEDMGTYFVDFPDLAHSLQSIQIQRGVGTSTVGTPSFGGSVNLQSIDLSQTQQVSARVAGGSFGTKFGTVGYQSGALPGGFAFYTRLSASDTNGFRENSATAQNNLFFSGAKQNEDSQIRFTGFFGHEHQQSSYVAADTGTLASDLRATPMQPEERDKFAYELANLEYLKSFANGGSLSAQAFYQRGYGWFRLFDDEVNKAGLRQYGLDGKLAGAMVTYSRVFGALTTNFGVHVNEFTRDHTSDLVGGARDYFNYGTKNEANAFAKATLDRAVWHWYGDAQLRYTDFHYHGDVAIDPIHWTFFNPKLGVRRDLPAQTGVYASAGMSTREPTRTDLFQGEDNATIAHDLHAVKPERLYDFEAGADWHTSHAVVKANLYAMEFRNEIAATGQLSDIGLELRRNVDRSYRRGIEIDAAFDATSQLRLRTVASLSRNRIHTWTQYYDVYDAGGNLTGSQPIAYHDVEPVLTPSVIASEEVAWTPSAKIAASLAGRWVGRSFLDNTDNPAFVAPDFFTLDGNASYEIARKTRVTLQANNITNNKRVFPNGYAYVYLSDGVMTGTSYLFPQATRNFVVMLDWGM